MILRQLIHKNKRDKISLVRRWNIMSYSQLYDYQVIYDYDVVFIIDIESTMSRAIENVKKNILDIIRFARRRAEDDKIDYFLRVQFITFGDIGEGIPITYSGFFTKDDEIERYLKGIKTRGNSKRSNSLEAIAGAIKNVEWTLEGRRRRHVTILFTNKEPLQLGQRSYSTTYPNGMPKDLKELRDWWEGLNYELETSLKQTAKRLMLYVPNTHPWDKIIYEWNCVWGIYCDSYFNLCDIEIVQAIDLFVHDDI